MNDNGDIEVELELALLNGYREKIMDAIHSIYASTASTNVEIPEDLLKGLVEIERRIERAPATVTMKRIMRMK